MKRGKPLRADPEKVREFQRRAREQALERERQKQRDGLPRGKGLRKTSDSREPPVVFRAREPARNGKCFRCRRRANHWHHWTPQQFIRVYVRGLRLPREQARPLLRDLLRDERNLVRVCHACHGGHTVASAGSSFTRADVPESAFDFARELGEEYVVRLEREYPATGSGGSQEEGARDG